MPPLGDQNSLQITAEASAWLAQLESQPLSSEDLAAFSEWVNRSPRHAQEIREIAALSADLGVLTELIEPLGALRAKKQSVAEAAVQRLRRLLLPVTAASLLLLVGLTAYFQFYGEKAVHEFYTTGTGEYSTLELPDGSSVKLNTDTAVEVVYDLHMREVRLAKGEAYFKVAHNQRRPFVVYAGDRCARAIGTEFAVRLLADETELIVTKGIVAFAKALPAMSDVAQVAGNTMPASAQPLLQPVLVSAGFRVISTPDERKEAPVQLSARKERQEISWTEGLFDFSDTPLSEVVKEVSRHTTLKISIADKTLENVKVGGMFRIGDIDTLLESLARLGVKVSRTPDGNVVLQDSSKT